MTANPNPTEPGHDDEEVLKVPAEFTDETPTPPNGLSLDARQWQNTDEDVRDLDFSQFRTDR